MFELTVSDSLVAKDKKKYKLTDDEYTSLPSYISVYNARGKGIPASLIKDWRKDNPYQPTALDTNRVEVIDKSGKRTGKFLDFSKTTSSEKKAQRSLEKVNIERIAKAQAKQPKTPEKDISRIASDISTLSSTAKRLEELDIESGAIRGQIETKSDSIKILSEGIKQQKMAVGRKDLISGKRKFTTKEKQTAEIVRANINRSLRAGVSIDKIRELIKDNWGMTLEEFNTIYKNNQ